MTARTWKDREFEYCALLVQARGDDSVGRDPKDIAQYLRLQAANAFRDNEFELSAHLCAAATAINEDARNNHEPDWELAYTILFVALRRAL
jgi:hypothetical protein